MPEKDKTISSKQWSSSIGFIFACAGSAVGLGNIWKFPYITHKNNGGSFVIIYLISVLIVGLPILLSEMLIGRKGKENAYSSLKKLSKNSIFGKILGGISVFCAFGILCYYSVVAGWTLEYFFHSLIGTFTKLGPDQIINRFGQFQANGYKQVLYHSIFMFITAFVVYRGTKGIEKTAKIIMPLLTLFIILITSCSIYNFGIEQTLNFLFNFDPQTITAGSILEAVGHAFFTLSIGQGTMLIYGAYLPKKFSIVKTSFWIVLFDTLIAFMACFMMFPIIFGTEMNIQESSSILFTSLTVQFNILPGGQVISSLFFLLVACAALTSTIAQLEPVVAFANENLKIERKKATIYTSLVIWIIGVGGALGMGAVKFFTKINLVHFFDTLTSNWTIPISGLGLALFCGHFLKDKDKNEEFQKSETKIFYIWNIMVKYISPTLVLFAIAYTFLK